jgi:hypothetical protein
MSPLVLAIVALLVAFLAWKVVKGVFKLLSIGAIVVMAMVIYYNGGLA